MIGQIIAVNSIRLRHEKVFFVMFFSILRRDAGARLPDGSTCESQKQQRQNGLNSLDRLTFENFAS